LIACRNVLIYLEPDAQRRVLHTLGEHLAPGGYLCLGEAEWPSPACEASWEVVSRKARLFRARRTDRPQGVK
jgi:two-component system CheB/CheR fusion protein